MRREKTPFQMLNCQRKYTAEQAVSKALRVYSTSEEILRFYEALATRLGEQGSERPYKEANLLIRNQLLNTDFDFSKRRLWGGALPTFSKQRELKSSESSSKRTT